MDEQPSCAGSPSTTSSIGTCSLARPHVNGKTVIFLKPLSLFSDCEFKINVLGTMSGTQKALNK